MKKSLTLALLALAGAFAAQAAHVTAQRAGDIALAYANAQNGAPANLAAKSVESMGESLYLVHFAPKGFAIVSADDNATPIIGYSLEGNITRNSMPDNMAYILTEADAMVNYQKVNGTTNRMWQKIENGLVRQSRGGEPVDYLIQVKWNQGSPYNKYCPGEGSNRAVVGCVAVAMSQAMSVQKYPSRPNGQITYGSANYGQLSVDLDKEPDYDWDAILSGSNDKNEVARLLYHAGMSVHMEYGSDGSGIPSNQVYRISNALKDNFGYYDDVKYTWRSGYSGDWEQLLLNELYAGRAIVYNAIDTQGGYGHSFNIDGYDGSLYHLNWGWGGTGNGYFSINNLSDSAMGMNYDSSHVAVTGIGAANSPIKSIELSDCYVEANQPAGTPVCTLHVNGAVPDLAEMNVTITGEYDKSTNNYKTVPFEYKDGLILTTEEIQKSQGSIYLRIVVSMASDSKVKLTQGYTIEIEDYQPIEHRTWLSYDRLTKDFTVHTKFNSTYVVKDAAGNIVLSGSTVDNPDFTFNRSLLQVGNNTLEIKLGSETKTITLSL